MIIRHQLFHGDLQRRINFCNWFQARPARFFERDILIGDEATFRMDCCVNTWNVRSYAPRNQSPAHFEYYRNCSKEKLTVWAGLIGSGEILGPYFFVPNIRGRFEERNNGRLARGWWVQDGAPAHLARTVTARLNELLGKRIVSPGQEHEWPPRSPVYKTPPANVDELLLK